MPKSGSRVKHERPELDRIFERANKQWDEGKLRSAFRLFLAGAKAGDSACRLNLGSFYSGGIGVKANRALALYWYRRAYRQGYGAAANNIGIMFREEKKPKQALAWFERAVNLKDGDASLEIAKIYIESKDRKKAIRYLKQTCKAAPDEVTKASREEAQRLLKRLGPNAKEGVLKSHLQRPASSGGRQLC